MHVYVFVHLIDKDPAIYYLILTVDFSDLICFVSSDSGNFMFLCHFFWSLVGKRVRVAGGSGSSISSWERIYKY
ncbi:unnamed protein product [Arabidopsis lyrata]|nr:unnamed protein product [Arabidopsis lyrata]